MKLALAPLVAMTDEELWGPTFAGDSWRAFVAATSGLPLGEEGLALYRRCSGGLKAPTRPRQP